MPLTPLFLLCFSAAMASPVGNLANPAILEEGFWISDRCGSSVRAGIIGDFVWLKPLHPCHRHSGISHSEMNWTLAVSDVGWNIRERFDLHFLVGPVASVRFQWRQSGLRYIAHSDRGLFWGASSKIILLEVQDTTVGVDFHGGGIEWMEGALRGSSSQGFTSRLYFWQIASGLSQNIGIFRPYAGAAINELTCIFHPTDSHKLRFHDLLKVGTFEGCTVSLGARMDLNVEARQIFESGLTIAGDLRF